MRRFGIAAAIAIISASFSVLISYALLGGPRGGGAQEKVTIIAKPAPLYRDKAVLHPAEDQYITETIHLPLSTFVDHSVMNHGAALGSGAIEAIGGRLIIVDTYGKFFRYQNGVVEDNALPELPMHVAEFQDKSGRVFNSWSMRTHDLKRDPKTDYIYASYERYELSRNLTHFEISRLLVDVDGRAVGRDWEIVFSSPDIPAAPGGQIFADDGSGMLAFSGDDLFFNIGAYNLPTSRLDIPYPQDETSVFGKTFKINIVTHQLTLVSKGHRNSEGLVVTSKGEVWATEHGPRGGDKLNVILQGGNYGYPYEGYSFGTDYHQYDAAETGKKFTKDNIVQPLIYSARTGTAAPREFIAPIFSWVPSIAPSSIIELSSFNSMWDGDFLVGTLKAQSLYRVKIVDHKVMFVEPILINHRIRDILNLQGQIVLWTDDGALVFLSVADDLLKTERLGTEPLYGDPQFANCTVCHSLSDRNPKPWAPSLAGVFGRKIAGSSFANYSEALKKTDGVWDEDTLAAFLTSPSKFAPGTTMSDVPLDSDLIVHIVEALKAQRH